MTIATKQVEIENLTKNENVVKWAIWIRFIQFAI